MLRVGGGYAKFSTKFRSSTNSVSSECCNCELIAEELQRCKDQLEEEKKKNIDLQDKITVMIEEQALEELNVMNKLDQVMNLVKSV
jgi:glutamine synthetase type III